MDNPIATFLSLAVPWASTGYVTIEWPYTPPDLPPGANPPMAGQAFKSIDAAVRYIHARRTHSDLFVGMSLQAQAEPKMNRHGRRYYKARRHRNQALLLRSFWLDVDIKHGFFRDTQHALEVFGEWRRAIGLPPPTLIVLTGSGGFHAYWVLDEPIDRETWQPLADALANAAGSLKPLPGPDGEERRLDIGLTTNPACLLRIPDTFNCKHTPPTLAQLAHVGDVYSFSVIDNALSKHKGIYSPAKIAKPTALRASSVFAGMAKPTSLAAGLDDRWRPTAEEVADVCPWFARVKHTNGAGCSEPEWFTSLQVAFFCQQGSELAHELSDEHPTYTEEETDRKFALVEESHASGRLGWPQCKTIHLNGGPECRLCPHLSEGKSPLNFIVMAPAEQPVPIIARTGKESDVQQPMGYSQDADGIVYKDGSKEDEASQPICRLPIFNVNTQVKQDDGSGRSAVMFDTYTDAQRQRFVVISYRALYDPRMFVDELAKHDMMVLTSELLRKYLISYAEQLRLRKKTSGKSEPYGWSFDDNNQITGFVAGEKRYNCAGITRVAPLSQEIARHYRPAGSLDIFKKNAALITQQERYDLITVLTTAIGGPLTYMTGLGGLVVHACGPAGLGKSHAALTAQSFWSNPKLEQSILDDTANYLVAKLAMLRNMPLYYDDVKGKGVTDEMLKLIFAVTLGRSKGRATPTGDAKEVFEFCTMLTIMSNNSLVDYMHEHDKTSTAGLDRVFEIPIQPNTTGMGLIDRAEAQQTMGQLSRNFGYAGALCAEFFGKNIESIDQSVKKAHSELTKIVDANGPERWWAGAMSVCYIGARIANKLDLMQIDEKKLLEFLIANFYRLRDVVGSSPTDISKPESVERFIQQYIADRTRMVLVTDTVPTTEGRPTTSYPLNPLDYKDGVRIRYAKQNKLLRFSKADFRHWLKNGPHKVGPSEIVQAIFATLPAKQNRVSLANGTNLVGIGREDVIEITNWNHFNMEDGS